MCPVFENNEEQDTERKQDHIHRTRDHSQNHEHTGEENLLRDKDVKREVYIYSCMIYCFV